MSRRLIALGATLLAAAAPRVAAGQATVVVDSSIAVGSLYDDNVTWQPDAKSDRVLRITPAIAVRRDSPRSSWRIDATGDAERYSRYQDLSTPAANQHAGTEWRWQATDRTRAGFLASYDSSVSAADLNLGTGLALGRLRAWRWFGGPVFARTLTPRVTLDLAPRVTGELASTLPGVVTYTVDAGVTRRVGARDRVETRYVGDVFDFASLGRSVSNRGLIRWIHRMTPAWEASLAGGGRWHDQTWRPDVDARVTRSGQWTNVLLAYTWDQVTAIGVRQLVDVQSGNATVSYDRARRAGASLSASVYRNVLGTQRIDVYRGAAEVRHVIAGPLWMAVDYTFDYQRGASLARSLPLLVAPDDTGVPLDLGAQGVRRSSALVRLIVMGRMQSSSGPSERSAGADGSAVDGGHR